MTNLLAVKTSKDWTPWRSSFFLCYARLMSTLNETEQAEVLRFLGYANWADLASSFQLGFPAPSQPEYLVRDAFVRLTDEGSDLVRRDLRELKCIENQMSESRSRLKAEKIGNLKLNSTELKDLQEHMTYWVKRLASDLGVYENPLGHNPLMSGRNARIVNG